MSKNKSYSVKKKKKSSDKKYRWKYFGNVAYLVDATGSVIEIKASNGVFRIKNSFFF